MEPSLTRNIGIIAHIDAGKTTFTERALFYSHTISRMGEVHEGSATMDFLPDEQERGITIAAACSHCVWNGHEINIIDTPGHVDFTMEVERSLRVLDGAIGIFCAVSGVEPQSELIWRQSERYKIPKLAVVNKMDKPGADFINVLIELNDKLGVRPLPVTVPIGQGELFSGVIDLVNKQTVLFDAEGLGKNVTRSPWTDDIAALAAPYYEDLIDFITENNDELLSQCLAGKELTPEQIMEAIKEGTQAGHFTPVFAAAAFRNIGIQPVLDAVCQYLPSPVDRHEFLKREDTANPAIAPYPPSTKEPFCAFVFKTSRDKKGKVVFLRVYSGRLKQGEQVYIARTGEVLDTRALSNIYASSRELVEEAVAGDIIALEGTNALTGDTIVDREPYIELEPITAYPPVISQVFESSTAEGTLPLEEALQIIVEEDPTLSLQNEDGRLLLSGMGELHLDVVKKRLVHQFNIIPRVGFPEVVSLETPVKEARGEGSFCQQLGTIESCGCVVLNIVPVEIEEERAQAALPVVLFSDKIKVSRNFKGAVHDAIMAACNTGVLGFPVRRIKVVVQQVARVKDSMHTKESRETRTTGDISNMGEIRNTKDTRDVKAKDAKTPKSARAVKHSRETRNTVDELVRTDLPAVYKAAVAALDNALQASGTLLLEPLMKIEISVPNQHLGAAISLLGSCNAKIEDVSDRHGLKQVIAFGAMKSLFSFATRLRSVTQGRGEMSIQFAKFVNMEAYSG